jgi:hypothetical protein
MIATWYRGGTEIEDDFRIGALCSTPLKLPIVTVVKIFYLIKNDTEDRNVRSKEQYLHKHGIELKDIDIGRYIGDGNCWVWGIVYSITSNDVIWANINFIYFSHITLF